MNYLIILWNSYSIVMRSKRFDLVCSFDLINFLTPYNSQVLLLYTSCEYCITEMKFGRYYFKDDIHKRQAIQKRINSKVVQTNRAEGLT